MTAQTAVFSYGSFVMVNEGEFMGVAKCFVQEYLGDRQYSVFVPDVGVRRFLESELSATDMSAVHSSCCTLGCTVCGPS